MRIVRLPREPNWPEELASNYAVGTIVENGGDYFQVERGDGYESINNYWEYVDDYAE